MTKASDNEFPSVLLDEQASAPTTPATGFWRVYAKSDGLYIVDDAGTETGPLSTGGGGGGSGADTITIPMAAWDASIGSIGAGNVTGATTRFKGWAFDSTTAEFVGSQFVVPTGWTAIDMKMAWMRNGTGSGDVVWEMQNLDLIDGETTNSAGTAQGFVTATAPSQYLLDVVTLVSGLSVTAGDLHFLRVIRRAGEAADTLSEDAIMVGFWIVDATP